MQIPQTGFFASYVIANVLLVPIIVVAATSVYYAWIIIAHGIKKPEKASPLISKLQDF